MVQRLKFGNGYVISYHILLSMEFELKHVSKMTNMVCNMSLLETDSRVMQSMYCMNHN